MIDFSKKILYVNIFFLLALIFTAVLFKFKSIQNSDLQIKDEKVLKFILPLDDVSDYPYGLIYSTKLILERVRRKKIIKIGLIGNYQEDQKRFEFIRQEARRLKYTCDTTAVIQVHFIKENTYGQFVYLVNMMIEDQHKSYALANDNFYIFGENPPLPDSLKKQMIGL
ncbi:hypothetical protein GALL_63420 [mine drainage metagenome]|uniref:Uncharacterized protein n=1 Tax=mine drainage metagenome TaxID=410659 RepID=A0A1J5SVT9_9ZZZZ